MARPRTIKDPQEMWKRAEAYFTKQDKNAKPYTVPGVCIALGFNHRNALSEYERRPEFTSTIKEIRLRIENQMLENLQSGKGFGVGYIFSLKNNFGYKDQQHTVFEDRLNRFVERLPGVIGDFIPADRKEAAWQALRDLAADLEGDQGNA